MSAYGSNFCLFLLNTFKTEGHANVFWYVLLIIHPLIEMVKTWMTNGVQTTQDICLYLQPDISKLSLPCNILLFHCNSLTYWSLDKHMLHEFFISWSDFFYLVDIHAVDHCVFLILEYNKWESLQNKNYVSLDSFHDKKFYLVCWYDDQPCFV